MSRGGVGTGAAVGMANRHGYQTGAGPQAGQNPSHAGKEVLRELVSKSYKHIAIKLHVRACRALAPS